ncbi:hypothetical protein C3F09_04335 [candidate division GN15 bacterium]|uniref:FlgD/Vpr Ig-like domain-containing protein n=1 Tax=candidate division GN15 bacterium TaxID=2072418 RepID=A0A855X975_9BACT|nr:MAG: hypothetical protein C3F09_04335 [candidate division GN15 bacterium]
MPVASTSDGITFLDCPSTLTFSHCPPSGWHFAAVKTQGARTEHGIRYSMVSGPGEIDENTGQWSFDPGSVDPSEWGKWFPVVVKAALGNGSGRNADSCSFSFRIFNFPPRPVYTGPERWDSIPVVAYRSNVIPILWRDYDSCDVIQKTISSIRPTPAGTIYLDSNDDLVFYPLAADTGKKYSVTLTASDRYTSGSTGFSLFVESPVARTSEYSLRIGKLHDVLQGQMQDVKVTLERASADTLIGGLGGFDLLLGYDATALSLQAVLNDSSLFYQQCMWEYFTYRYGADGNCGLACPSGTLRVVGLAETNNGPVHPSCTPKYLPGLPATLFTVKFLVSNDRTIECTSLPIRFLWRDCANNSLLSWDGRQSHVANRVYEFEPFTMCDTGVLIDPNLAAFPGTSGLPVDTCLLGDPERPISLRDVDFYHGGLDIICADSIDPRDCWQDWNFPIDPYIRGCIAFAYYFLYDTGATVDPEWLLKCTDVNADGTPLTLSDFVYLQHIIVGDALPYPPLYSVDTAHLTCLDYSSPIGLISADTLGAVRLVFEGEVAPELLAPGASIMSAFWHDSTFVLISGSCLDSVPHIVSGSLINAPGAHRLVKADAASYDGARVPVVIDYVTSAEDHRSESLPLTFALRQNYPNPFNAGTVISFDLPKAADVRVEVLNVAGQLVYQVNRRLVAGSHKIEWDGTVNGRSVASGVYYYRVSAGEFTATKKMVLLK